MTRKVFIMMFLAFLCFTAYGQKIHTVKQGETLESIASLYHVSTNELKGVNENTEVLFPGLILTIPEKEIKTQPQHVEKQEAPELDKVEMKDGSYIVCKVVSVKKTTLIIKQEEIEGNISIPIKEVLEVFYANGKKRKFGKR